MNHNFLLRGLLLSSTLLLYLLFADALSSTAQEPSPTESTYRDSQIALINTCHECFKDVYVLNVGDLTAKQVSSVRPGPSSSPNWSPDGKRIVFIALSAYSAEGLYWQIHVANIETSEVTQLTKIKANHYAPEWSPNGKYIAFISDRDGFHEVYEMNPDGSLQQRITQSESPNDEQYNRVLTWSPDSRYIAYVSLKDYIFGKTPLLAIYALNVEQALKNTAKPINVSARVTDCSNFGEIDWSPKQEFLAFTSYCEGFNNIYLLKVDQVLAGGNPSSAVQVTDGSNDWYSIDWLPDGEHIMSNTIISKLRNIFIIDVTNTLKTKKLQSTQLTKNTDEFVYYYEPAWKPK